MSFRRCFSRSFSFFSLPLVLVTSLMASGLSRAEAPASARDFLAQFAAEAKAPGDAARGATFFRSTHGKEWSCASCHGERPLGDGKHASTGKRIAPLAPAANAERFTRADKVEKWFKRNCNDVVGRACTPGEKADVLAFLLSLKP